MLFGNENLCIIVYPDYVAQLKGEINMKKILILSIIALFALPALASCPIDGGACTASNWDSKPLIRKYLPDRLDDIQRTDAFKPQYFQPYNDTLINAEPTVSPAASINQYNSNCQFGVCLPDAKPESGVIE